MTLSATSVRSGRAGAGMRGGLMRLENDGLGAMIDGLDADLGKKKK